MNQAKNHRTTKNTLQDPIYSKKSKQKDPHLEETTLNLKIAKTKLKIQTYYKKS